MHTLIRKLDGKEVTQVSGGGDTHFVPRDRSQLSFYNGIDLMIGRLGQNPWGLFSAKNYSPHYFVYFPTSPFRYTPIN